MSIDIHINIDISHTNDDNDKAPTARGTCPEGAKGGPKEGGS